MARSLYPSMISKATLASNSKTYSSCPSHGQIMLQESLTWEKNVSRTRSNLYSVYAGVRRFVNQFLYLLPKVYFLHLYYTVHLFYKILFLFFVDCKNERKPRFCPHATAHDAPISSSWATTTATRWLSFLLDECHSHLYPLHCWICDLYFFQR